MALLLTARQTNSTECRLMLRAGQEARVGSSDLVELSIACDDKIAPEHFLVRCGAEAIVEVLNEAQSLLVDGDGIDRLTLSQRSERTADFVAGQTRFSVCWTPDRAFVSTDQTESNEPENQSVDDNSELIAKVAIEMKLSNEAQAQRESPDTVCDYAERLTAAELNDDALRFLARTLSPVDAVDWAVGCCQWNDSADPMTLAIQKWLESPDDTQRQLVDDQLQKGQPSGASRWVAKAIVLSGGSLAPDGQKAIAPPPHLSAIAIVTAHRWSVANRPNREEAVLEWMESGLLRLRKAALTLNDGTE